MTTFLRPLTLGVCVLFLSACTAPADAKEVLFIAGPPSHGYGSHEHYAGCRLLAAAITKADPSVRTHVTRGWPQDASLLESADSIVIYCDGGGRHIALPHRDQMARLMEADKGLVCLHYAVEVPKGQPGQDFLDWLGGYFETDWSVNPHWDAAFTKMPEHPITRGVEPFTARDEWYFHMRYRPGMEGITPILSAVPPESTMQRPDGPHSGNPTVRKEVAEGKPQVVAWAFDRPDGGRSFGFTGGHFHWNWGREDIRDLVANAILWTAGVEIPQGGFNTPDVGVDQLLENQDYDKPDDFDPQRVKEEFHLEAAAQQSSGDPRVLFSSDVVTGSTQGHRVDIKLNLDGAKTVYLVATDGGDGFTADWVDWIAPTLSGAQGELDLTTQPMLVTSTGWGSVHVGKNANGGEATVEGRTVSPVIGTHAPSVIGFRVPKGFDELSVSGALDTGGTSQNGGRSSSVRFLVYADAAPEDLGAVEAKLIDEQRAPEKAIAGLDVADGLELTLVASEPWLKSLTNIDVDARGRIWACEVMNYRRNDGSRPEGDRIVILEDSDGDGRADSQKTYYQGRDIDSAMGICVLGNQVIVSASPHVWRFTDEDGDDIPDRKELMFSKTGQPQHDHSAHSFIFGPDGKLYWNFGNTGQSVHRPDGELVVDIHGRPVIDNGKPFFGGMPFRCNLDGSQFEVLAHNFRNNYEVTVDSFGDIWQSDNDDDGNRATRINFILEQGNYGYLDEMTGAGWREPRIGMHDEIPLRHWHLRDPGVVPNLLNTGAGSPTGITVYEGDLLPSWLHGEVVHCDAGPNVVRAYPAKPDGAGYSATVEDLVVGIRDRWFRPADVCVAPDGSLFISDWYDPGVGGHRQEDLARGRLFRLAPPGAPYEIPQHDYSTVDGAIAALGSPAGSVRYLAWQSLLGAGAEADRALRDMFAEEDPVMRARALWLLGKRPGGEQWIATAIRDRDEKIRTVGVRLARQLGVSPANIAGHLVEDPSAAVRRELLISLRFDDSDSMPQLWARLAAHYEGRDRWYFEALGIGSDLRADECFAAWLDQVDGQWDTPAGRDIVWRVRASESADRIAEIIADPSLTLEETDRYFRSLELRQPADRNRALEQLLSSQALLAADGASRTRNDAIIVRAVERLDGFDLARSQPHIRAAVMRHVERAKGTADFPELVARFGLREFDDALLMMAANASDSTAGVRAAEVLLGTEGGPDRLKVAIEHPGNPEHSQSLVNVLGLVGKPDAIRVLVDVVQNSEITFPLRSAGVRSMTKSNIGQNRLVKLAEAGRLPPDLRLLAGGLLSQSENQEIRTAAANVLPLPQTPDRKPVPPVDQLVAQSGNARRGQELFFTKATCGNCHVVDGKGKEVGPNLSEIGDKLAKAEMFVSILDPGAGISHNYENYIALLDSGQVVTGVKVSETADSVTLRTAEAIDRQLPVDQIDVLKKSEKSIMPENLHHTVDQQGLVDIVEYMATLRKKK